MGKNKTNVEYIQELKEKRPDIEVLEEYINSRTAILHKCSCGNNWSVRPDCVLIGYNCMSCRINERRMPFEKADLFVKNLGYEIVDSENYKNTRVPVILKDSFGYYYKTNINNLHSRQTPNMVHKSNPFSIQNIKLFCKLYDKPFELVSDNYENAHKPLQWKCLKNNCGEIFKASWTSIRDNNCSCGICAGRQIAMSNCLAVKNPDLSSEWHPTKNGKLTPYDVTCGNGQKVWWICKNGHELKKSTNERSIFGCPYCSGRYSTPENNLLISNPKLCEEWDYIKNKNFPQEYAPNSNKKAWWICSKCNHSWQAVVGSRSRGNGCPCCAESKGEKRILQYLNNNYFVNINDIEYNQLRSKPDKCYIAQKIFEGLVGLGGKNLSYDFYLPAPYNLLIEYQGEQHEKYIKGLHQSKKKFEKQQEHDRRKREYALNNNIKLLEIWYWDFDNIETILQSRI